jgi:dedicator of cytokinesis protein 3
VLIVAAEELPGILSRSEITKIEYEQVSPIQGAILEVAKASTGVRNLISGRNGHIDVKLLGTTINGAVDSPVNGGIKLYRTVCLHAGSC